MRLLFEKGKQRELLKKEKELKNLSWSKFSKQLNLNESRLKAFYYDGVLIDEDTFNKLNLRKDYEKFIIKQLEENWGQSKGGKISSGNLKEIKVPEKNEELAELWGILLGDGNIQKRKGYKIGTYNIKVTGHSILDKNYLLKFVKPLIEKLFNIKVRFYPSRHSNALNIVADSRKIVNFFEENGFNAGDKIKNQVGIPTWIKENPRFLAVCLRGLYDTDGCFYRLTNQNSYQIHFKNYNKSLLNDVHVGLISLGIKPSKIICGKSIVITRKSEIEKFYKTIGFHNSKHLNKINAYLEAL
ncbi:MAG: LAGLIDADG family homing endonuclease [Nanoarchaeota archaeon]|mgnify:CR=1 FL=1